VQEDAGAMEEDAGLPGPLSRSRACPPDDVERMKNNAEITHYASYNKRMD
jgi:hypothetical protein